MVKSSVSSRNIQFCKGEQKFDFSLNHEILNYFYGVQSRGVPLYTIYNLLSSSTITMEDVEGSVGVVPSRLSRIVVNTSCVSNMSSLMIEMGTHIWEGPPGLKTTDVRVGE